MSFFQSTEDPDYDDNQTGKEIVFLIGLFLGMLMGLIIANFVHNLKVVKQDYFTTSTPYVLQQQFSFYNEPGCEGWCDDTTEVKKDTTKNILKSWVLEDVVSKSFLAGVDPIKALQIAKCESNYDDGARNKHTSAKGLFQFLDGTWNKYCSGDVFSASDNTDCFVKLYKIHPSWWECK